MKVLAPGEVRAVLGPTNSGKTYLAIQRMLAHRSGIIGLPLRLLAREVYEKVVAARGRDKVALVTGEEKKVPQDARYFVCTVEAMPDRPAAFVAVDEVQLCASPDRGHTFTDRVLGSRGLLETLFLGSETMAPLLEKMVPGIVLERKPRMSTLRHVAPKKLTSLPPRSAVVAFSMSEVYELAERLKRKHGGAAVVLGALSPRTRNAQVAMYQAGEVQHLVATDAIGMGLNLDIDHVAFAATQKFDGREIRPLLSHEVAQIAGRAGRATRDGTFGLTTGQAPLDPEIVRAVENHTFPDVRRVTWRNHALDFRSIESLIESLTSEPRRGFMDRVRAAYDMDALLVLAKDAEVQRRAHGEEAVELLWEVCQIPDYRKTLTDSHTVLLKHIHAHLSGPHHRLGTDWVTHQLDELDRTAGDIETLMTRIAFVRTWAYVTFRADWMDDALALQARTQAIEDHLSDALHDALTRRFVDRKGTVVAPRFQDAAAPRASNGALTFGEALQRTVGRTLAPAAVLPSPDRAARVVGAPDAAFTFDRDGTLRWEGQAIARLKPGHTPATPTVQLTRHTDLRTRPEVEVRLTAFLRAWLARHFDPLRIESLDPGVRGLSHALIQGLGSVGSDEFAEVVSRLKPRDRRALGRAGIRLGRHVIYSGTFLTPVSMEARAILAGVFVDLAPPEVLEAAPPAAFVPEWDPSHLPLLGYTAVAGRALRHDVFESVAALVRQGRSGDLGGLLGPLEADAPLVARALRDGRAKARRRA